MAKIIVPKGKIISTSTPPPKIQTGIDKFAGKLANGIIKKS